MALLNNPYYKAFNALLSNLDTYISQFKKDVVDKKGRIRVRFLENLFFLSLILLRQNGEIKIPFKSVRDFYSELANVILKTILSDADLREYAEYVMFKDKKRTLNYNSVLKYITAIKPKIYDTKASNFMISIEYDEGHIILSLTDTAKALLSALQVPLKPLQVEAEEIKEKLKQKFLAPEQPPVELEPQEEEQPEQQEAEIIQPEEPEVTPKTTEVETIPKETTVTQDQEPIVGEKKEPFWERKPVDMYDLVLRLIKVYYVPEVAQQSEVEIPVIKYLKQRSEEAAKTDLYIFYLNNDKIKETILQNKHLFYFLKYLKKEVTEKDYVETFENFLVNLFNSDKNDSMFIPISIALNKYLEQVYKKLKETGYLQDDISFDNFLLAILSKPDEDPVKSKVLSTIAQLKYLFVFNAEMLKSLRNGGVSIDSNSLYAAKAHGKAFVSFSVYKCDACGRYFYKTPDVAVSESEQEKARCPFCGSIHTHTVIDLKKKFHIRAIVYSKVSNKSSLEFFATEQVSRLLGEVIEADLTPIILINHPFQEIKKNSPVRNVLHFIIGILDKGLVEKEEVLVENFSKAINKLSSLKSIEEKLRVLARSVVAASSVRMLTHMEYPIIGALISLATATNHKIVLIDTEKGEEEELSNIKPSMNTLVIGRTASGKSSLIDLLTTFFRERASIKDMFQVTARQLMGYLTTHAPRRSVLLGFRDKLLIFEEAAYTRDEEVFGVMRSVMESGRVDDEFVNTAFMFVMNDPTNLDDKASKRYKLTQAIKLSHNILAREGTFRHLLYGLYTFNMIPIVAFTFTSAFAERIRMYVIAMQRNDILANILEEESRYRRLIHMLKEQNKLLSKQELRAFFIKHVFPIRTIYVTKSAYNLAYRYAQYYYVLIKKAAERLDESYSEIMKGEYFLSSSVTFTPDRIANAIVLIASGIAKLTQYDNVIESDNGNAVLVDENLIEIARKYYVIFSPDPAHEFALKQMEEVFKLFREIADRKGGITEADVKIEEIVSLLERVPLTEKLHHLVKETIAELVTINDLIETTYRTLHTIYKSPESLNPYEQFMHILMSVNKKLQNLTRQELEILENIAKEIIDFFVNNGIIKLMKDNRVYDVDPTRIQQYIGRKAFAYGYIKPIVEQAYRKYIGSSREHII